MARSSILGPDETPSLPPGHDVESLGPSDISDTGSDVQGSLDLNETDQKLSDLHSRHQPEDSLRQELQHSDSDTTGTGERASAILDDDARDGGDIAPDKIVTNPDGLDEVDDDEDIDDDRLDAA